jgi:uncharacterized protein
MDTSDEVEIIAHSSSSRLRLRVKAGARRSRVIGAHGGALKVEVQAPPERGRANEAVLRLVAEVVGVERRRLDLIIGAASQDKLIEIDGVAPTMVVTALIRAGVPAREGAQRPARGEVGGS